MNNKCIPITEETHNVHPRMNNMSLKITNEEEKYVYLLKKLNDHKKYVSMLTRAQVCQLKNTWTSKQKNLYYLFGFQDQFIRRFCNQIETARFDTKLQRLLQSTYCSHNSIYVSINATVKSHAHIHLRLAV
jgi:hypothetical protein